MLKVLKMIIEHLDQISDFPAPLRSLGIRLTRVARKLYYDAITAYSCRPWLRTEKDVEKRAGTRGGSKTMLQAQTETSGNSQPARFPFKSERAQFAIYALILAVSISTWFIVIRAPLWLDETVSMFLIKGVGRASCPARSGPTLRRTRACCGSGPR